MGCDVADEAQVIDLVARAEEAFGPVDLFCANAGVAVGTDLDTPEEAWELALGVNVRAHVYAAKALCPDGSSAARATSSPRPRRPGCSPRSAPRPTR